MTLCVRAVGSLDACNQPRPFTRTQSVINVRSYRAANQFRISRPNFVMISLRLSRAIPRYPALSRTETQIKKSQYPRIFAKVVSTGVRGRRYPFVEYTSALRRAARLMQPGNFRTKDNV